MRAPSLPAGADRGNATARWKPMLRDEFGPITRLKPGVVADLVGHAGAASALVLMRWMHLQSWRARRAAVPARKSGPHACAYR